MFLYPPLSTQKWSCIFLRSDIFCLIVIRYGTKETPQNLCILHHAPKLSREACQTRRNLGEALVYCPPPPPGRGGGGGGGSLAHKCATHPHPPTYKMAYYHLHHCYNSVTPAKHDPKWRSLIMELHGLIFMALQMIP